MRSKWKNAVGTAIEPEVKDMACDCLPESVRWSFDAAPKAKTSRPQKRNLDSTLLRSSATAESGKKKPARCTAPAKTFALCHVASLHISRSFHWRVLLNYLPRKILRNYMSSSD